jgi:hypothetical protein
MCFNLNYPACKAHSPHYIVFCGLSGCTIFYRISFKLSDFRDKKIEHENVGFDFLHNCCLKYFSPQK